MRELTNQEISEVSGGKDLLDSIVDAAVDGIRAITSALGHGNTADGLVGAGGGIRG